MTHNYHKRKLFDPRYIGYERRRAYRMATLLFWSVLLYFFFHTFVVSVGLVRERSMLPTLQDGDYFLVNKYIYHFRAPKRAEIVALRTYKLAPDQYVKRVIGLPGDMLEIREGKILINGKALSEPYARGYTYPDMGPFEVEQNRFFVVGDNRIESVDSRALGSVFRKDILGLIDPDRLFPFR